MQKIKFILSWLWKFLKPFITIFLTELGRAVAEAAMTAVTTAANMPDGTSNEKRRKAAYAYTKRILLDEGHEARDSMIYAAIEVALQALKTK
jgi:hypothetical protein